MKSGANLSGLGVTGLNSSAMRSAGSRLYSTPSCASVSSPPSTDVRASCCKGSATVSAKCADPTPAAFAPMPCTSSTATTAPATRAAMRTPRGRHATASTTAQASTTIAPLLRSSATRHASTIKTAHRRRDDSHAPRVRATSLHARLNSSNAPAKGISFHSVTA